MPSRWIEVVGWAALVLLGTATLLGVGSVVNYRLEQRELDARARGLTGGDLHRGEVAFVNYGCGSCHQITGVPSAQGLVGPPLSKIGDRAILAGRLENRPANLIRWIRDPQGVSPGTAMPNLGVTPSDARDIAAFLYTDS